MELTFHSPASEIPFSFSTSLFSFMSFFSSPVDRPLKGMLISMLRCVIEVAHGIAQ